MPALLHLHYNVLHINRVLPDTGINSKLGLGRSRHSTDGLDFNQLCDSFTFESANKLQLMRLKYMYQIFSS